MDPFDPNYDERRLAERRRLRRELAQQTAMLGNEFRRIAENIISGSSSRSQPPVRRRAHLFRDRDAANNRLMQDYFVDNPRYPEHIFRRRFRMSKRLFLRIAGDLEREFEYFEHRPDASGLLGFTAIQKCTSAIRILAYGNTTDINDEYLKMAEKTTRDSLENF